MMLVLLGALLHASWNAVVKSSRDKFIDTTLICGGSALLAVLALPFLPSPDPASWPFIGVSAAIHVAYFALVAAAYRAGDMSYAYPLMRGTAPLLVALASAPLLGEELSAAAWTGVLLICGGILVLALAYGRPGISRLPATAFALFNALVIAAYTFVDGIGVRLSGQPAAYLLWMLLLTAPPLFAWSVWRRPAALRRHLTERGAAGLIAVGLVGGACTFGSYWLALWAMTRAPVALVAALRETAILFGMAIAALVLKERFGPARYVAVAAIVSGAAVLRLG